MKNLGICAFAAATVLAASPAASAAQSFSGCATGAFVTCAQYSFSNVSSAYTFSITNLASSGSTTNQGGKWGSVFFLVSPGTDIANPVTTPLGWDQSNKGHNGNIWFNGAEAKYLNIKFDGNQATPNFLIIGQTLTINFTLSSGSLLGAGVHAQEGPTGSSQWIRFPSEGAPEPFQQVPEPASLALLGLGALGIGVVRARRKQAL